MRYLKYLAVLAVLVLPAIHSQAQVSFGVGVRIGPDYGIYNAPPVCEYGYYPDYPFDCAPYGYWGPEWFVDGVFIGAGPWYHFYYSHPVYWQRYYVVRDWDRFSRFHDRDRFFDRDRFRDRDRFIDRDRFRDHDRWEGFRDHDRGFRDGDRFRGGDRGFHNGDRFRGGDRSFQGGERFRGGNGGREFHGGERFRDSGSRENHGGGHEHGGRR